MLIRSLRVRNFRSLRDVTIGDLDRVVILYGDNDTGKSNLLAFLEILFQEKSTEEVTELPQEGRVSRRSPSPFWRGTLEDFGDNFFRNTDDPITYSVNLRLRTDDIRRIAGASGGFAASLPRNSPWSHLIIEGVIRREEADRATAALALVTLNQKLFFDSSLTGTDQFLPGFRGLPPAETTAVFDAVMGQLTNAFLKIPAARFIGQEQELERNAPIGLTPSTYKNWLLQVNLARDRESLFRRIAEQFSQPPFGKGLLTIARVLERGLEVLVEDERGLKLPIGRKGSGVQQILMILSYVLSSKARFVGIEELEVNLSPSTQDAIFNQLFQLVQIDGGPIGQLFLTTHSPHIGIRNEAARRGVWLENGETKVSKPSIAQVKEFFRIR